ncbi:MAG: AraC family transcriptional regulator [Defluviitaleaceae bacterium]|nr:AraC family transcriptional regulator [Defluviitaleaceae bacterium]
MNCFEETEIVIEYIENHLEGGINVNYISTIIGIPVGLYQRIFSYVCGVSIAEYTRRRRLMLAVQKILSGNTNIIDIALEYGYESHSSFTRAVKEHFGVPPKSLTSEIYQNNYFARFSFHKNDESYLVMKERKIMAELVKIEYTTMCERKIIGVSKTIEGVGGRALWDAYFGKGVDKLLNDLAQFQCTDIDSYIGIGYARDFPDEKSLGDEYIVGKYFTENTVMPSEWEKDGLVCRTIPTAVIAKAQIKGKNFDDILNSAYILINDIARKNGYRLDYTDFYWAEVYTWERFCKPMENGASEIILDWFMPCIKENS